MLDALGEWMSQPYYYSVYGGPGRRADRCPARVDHRTVRSVPAAGGSQVFLGVQNDREWALLCDKVLGRPELIADERFATNSDRVAARAELTAIISAVLAR